MYLCASQGPFSKLVSSHLCPLSPWHYITTSVRLLIKFKEESCLYQRSAKSSQQAVGLLVRTQLPPWRARVSTSCCWRQTFSQGKKRKFIFLLIFFFLYSGWKLLLFLNQLLQNYFNVPAIIVRKLVSLFSLITHLLVSSPVSCVLDTIRVKRYQVPCRGEYACIASPFSSLY